MKTSLLICATCLLISGCSAQFRLPSLSSALSSFTGLGASSSNNQASSAQSTSPYSGLVRDYGRNLMMAMSSIYPTLFKPPQAQQQQAQPSPQSPFVDSSFANQFGNSQINPFSNQQQSPSFSFGGSTFSISPSLPSFASLSGNAASQQQQQQQQQPISSASSPFGSSFSSAINGPPSFGSLSNNAIFGQQSLNQQFAPSNSYQAALEAANGGLPLHGNGQSFENIRSSPQFQSSASSLVAQPSNSHPGSYSPLASFNGPHDSASAIISQNNQANQQHQGPIAQASNNIAHPNSFASPAQHNQFAPQQFRPDVLSIAGSAPIPSSNSYSNYGNLPQASGSQQGPHLSGSYQQPSFR